MKINAQNVSQSVHQHHKCHIWQDKKKMQRTSDLGCVSCIVCNWGNNSLLSWRSKYKTKIQSACIEGSPYTCSVSQFRSSIWNICLEKRDRISAILLIIYMRIRKQLIFLSFLKVEYIKIEQFSVLETRKPFLETEFSNLSSQQRRVAWFDWTVPTALQSVRNANLSKHRFGTAIKMGSPRRFISFHPAWGANCLIYSLGISFTGNCKLWRAKCQSVPNRAFVLRATTRASKSLLHLLGLKNGGFLLQ